MSSPKIVVITGANTGIGYETVKALVQSDQAYRIFVGSRSVEKGEAAIETLRKEFPQSTSTLEVLQVDVSTDESIQHAFETVKAKTEYIDVLINNAGAAFDGQIGLRDCFNQAYNINVSGAHVMTYIFMPLLLKSADPRLLFIAGLSQMSVASQQYFPTPPQPAGWPKHIDFETIGYRCSKTALNMLMIDYNHNSGSEICRGNNSPGQTTRTIYSGICTVQGNAGSHCSQTRDLIEPLVKNSLRYLAHTFSCRQQSHQLRLQFLLMPCVAAMDRERIATHGAQDEKGPSFNAIFHHLVFIRMKCVPAVDDKDTGTETGNLSPHVHEAAGQVDHFRLSSCVDDMRRPAC
ncbi:conserved hypothetical protein [Aspergillus terreus NIH2624]|uniref:Uncharacterized protein n=1 Tax=Aspergillus terreus (strain NIH 2624 / FGSC A1156) TaxID=341663 RepID=Q0CAF8_ASPTN|nr:uncharacterized protein ATEG_09326 [Aspergillus terreus NIH2624]EAU30463.1 conserved hypothetical protein [Aspergillus terreus NIH2624]